MIEERKSYVIYFNNDIIKALKKEKINIVYISKKNNYLIIYLDKKDEKRIISLLNKIPQISKIEESFLLNMEI